MASNLNKAFMRAYAKDSGRSVPPTAAQPTAAQPPEFPQQAQARPANVRAAGAPPAVGPTATSVPQRAVHSAGTRQMPAPQPLAPASVATPHLPMQTLAPTQVISGRYAQKPPTAAPADSATAVDAASVWQRIDAASSLQPPHLAQPPARPATASVGVGANSGPKRMQAAATAPAALTGRGVDLHQPQTADLPLLSEQGEAAPGDPQAVETRRRTVADFLYSAGKVPGSVTRIPASATASVDTHAGAGAPTFSSPASAAMPSHRAHAPAEVQSPWVAAGLAHSASTQYAANTIHGVSAVHAAHAASTVHAPLQLPQPVVLPGAGESPTLLPPSKRTGQILRVDVPTQARREAADFGVAPATTQRAADEATLEQARRGADVASPLSGASIEQRRTDRAHELCEAEQKLRRSTHKIFNPVWEVDSLQWPGVCDKLMEHRAESMAQVAAHLKAACQDGLSILGVTSPTSGEGRTTVACCLARLAASHGLSVVLVDLDLDHPTLCLQTNLEVEHDWRDCLDGEIGLEEVAVHSIDDQLTLLPLKDRSDRPELLASDTGIADLLRELSESFELVIVDACRMDSAGNVLSGLANAQIFDAAIVVVDRRNSHQERIEDAVRALQQTGVGSIGIVDNFSM